MRGKRKRVGLKPKTENGRGWEGKRREVWSEKRKGKVKNGEGPIVKRGLQLQLHGGG